MVRIHTHGEKNYDCLKDLQLSKRKTIIIIIIIVLFTVQLSLKLQQGIWSWTGLLYMEIKIPTFIQMLHHYNA